MKNYRNYSKQVKEEENAVSRREFLKKAALYVGGIALAGQTIVIASYNPARFEEILKNKLYPETTQPEPKKPSIDELVIPKMVDADIDYLRVFTGVRPENVAKKYENLGFSVKIDPWNRGGIVFVRTYMPKITDWLKLNEKQFKDAKAKTFPEQKKVYERDQLEDLVYYFSAKNGVDPRFGHSLARHESEFDQYAIANKLVEKEMKNEKGEVIKKLVKDPTKITALGVMQLNWRNGFAKPDGTRITWDELIGEPDLNIYAGTKHLKELVDKYSDGKHEKHLSSKTFRHNMNEISNIEARNIRKLFRKNPTEVLACAAYNAGEGSVETGNWVKYAETRRHVQMVMEFYADQKKENPDWQDIKIIKKTLGV